MDTITLRIQRSLVGANNNCVVRNNRVHWTSERRLQQMEMVAVNAGYASKLESKVVNGNTILTIVTLTK